MKEITEQMIKDFRLNKLKYDMMGYYFYRKQELSFHHLIVSHKDSKAVGIGEGYLYWNGAILKQLTSHDYLHVIQSVDPEIFAEITSELVDENIKRRVEMENLMAIRDMLLYFEKEHDHDTTKKGKLLIKREYVTERTPVLARERRKYFQ